MKVVADVLTVLVILSSIAAFYFVALVVPATAALLLIWLSTR